jgi:hypothetical protein
VDLAKVACIERAGVLFHIWYKKAEQNCRWNKFKSLWIKRRDEATDGKIEICQMGNYFDWFSGKRSGKTL